jgi:hypothetical protein
MVSNILPDGKTGADPRTEIGRAGPLATPIAF